MSSEEKKTCKVSRKKETFSQKNAKISPESVSRKNAIFPICFRTECEKFRWEPLVHMTIFIKGKQMVLH